VRAFVVAAAVAWVGVACGGATDIGEGGPAGNDGVPAFGNGSPVAATPVACIPCVRDDQCGDRAACIWPGNDSAYCAPGCTKEGFCASDRQCQWVRGDTGALVRACLPRGGCAH
jgi:hypothetical protein